LSFLKTQAQDACAPCTYRAANLHAAVDGSLEVSDDERACDDVLSIVLIEIKLDRRLDSGNGHERGVSSLGGLGHRLDGRKVGGDLSERVLGAGGLAQRGERVVALRGRWCAKHIERVNGSAARGRTTKEVRHILALLRGYREQQRE
jgi:hypothetical protein